MLFCCVFLQIPYFAWLKKRQSFAESVVNGATAGMAEVMISNPLIVWANTRILKTAGWQLPKASHNLSKKSLWDVAKKGLNKYYKGCGTGVLFMTPIIAMQNSAAVLFAHLIHSDPTLAQKTLAAFGAGTCSAMIESPADLVVLHRQHPQFKNESYTETWRRILKVRGLPTFYRGVAATSTRDGFITLSYKTGGDALQKALPLESNHRHIDKILCDTVSGGLAALVSQPAHVVSARMKNDLRKTTYRSCLQTAGSMAKQEGWRALFKGLGPRSMRLLLAKPLWSALIEREVGTETFKKCAAALKDLEVKVLWHSRIFNERF